MLSLFCIHSPKSINVGFPNDVMYPMFSNVEDYSNKIVGMFTNRNFALLFKESYKREYGVECFVISGFEYLKETMENG